MHEWKWNAPNSKESGISNATNLTNSWVCHFSCISFWCNSNDSYSSRWSVALSDAICSCISKWNAKKLVEMNCTTLAGCISVPIFRCVSRKMHRTDICHQFSWYNNAVFIFRAIYSYFNGYVYLRKGVRCKILSREFARLPQTCHCYSQQRRRTGKWLCRDHHRDCPHKLCVIP